MSGGPGSACTAAPWHSWCAVGNARNSTAGMVPQRPFAQPLHFLIPPRCRLLARLPGLLHTMGGYVGHSAKLWGCVHSSTIAMHGCHSHTNSGIPASLPAGAPLATAQARMHRPPKRRQQCLSKAAAQSFGSECCRLSWAPAGG